MIRLYSDLMGASGPSPGDAEFHDTSDKVPTDDLDTETASLLALRRCMMHKVDCHLVDDLLRQ